MQTTSDEVLIARIADGDRLAMQVLFARQVAAAGNAGPQSPPLYPAADPSVIAVTATDADDKLFA